MNNFYLYIYSITIFSLSTGLAETPERLDALTLYSTGMQLMARNLTSASLNRFIGSKQRFGY